MSFSKPFILRQLANVCHWPNVGAILPLLALAGPIAQAQIPLAQPVPVPGNAIQMLSLQRDSICCVGTTQMLSIQRDSICCVESLIEQLKSDDWKIRANAALKLEEMGVKATKAVPALTETLGDKDNDWGKRYRAARALVELRVEAISIVPALIEALPDDGFNLRVSLHGLLSYFKGGVVGAVTLFSKRLSNDNLIVRKNAVLRLKSLVANMDGAVNALVAALENPEWKARKQAVWTLGKLGQVAGIVVPGLITACGDDNLAVRKNAAWTLRELVEKSDLSVSALLKALADNNPEVRRQAALAFWKLSQEARTMIPLLTTALEDEPVHKTATWALSKIAKPKPVVVVALTKALGDGDDMVQIYARLALWRIDDRTELAVSDLINKLDYNSDVATKAAWALGEMGKPAIGAVPALIKMLEEYMLEEYQGVDFSANIIDKIFNVWQTNRFLSRTGRFGSIVPFYWERRTVAEALRKILPKAELLTMLENQDWATRYAAAKALGEFGEEANAVVPALIKASTDDNWRVRIGSIEALAVLGIRIPPILSTFEAAFLEDTNHEVRLAAKEALTSLFPATVEQLELIQAFKVIFIIVANIIMALTIILWLAWQLLSKESQSCQNKKAEKNTTTGIRYNNG